MAQGFDGSHLDVHISVRGVPDSPAAAQVTVSTLVKFNKLPGRANPAAVMPFRWLIVPYLPDNRQRKSQMPACQDQPF